MKQFIKLSMISVVLFLTAANVCSEKLPMKYLVEAAKHQAVGIAGGKLFVGKRDGTVEIWDIKSGEKIQSIKAHLDPVIGVWIHGPYFVTHDTHSVCIWEQESGKRLSLLSEAKGGIVDVCILEDKIHVFSKESYCFIYDVKKCIEIKASEEDYLCAVSGRWSSEDNWERQARFEHSNAIPYTLGIYGNKGHRVVKMLNWQKGQWELTPNPVQCIKFPRDCERVEDKFFGTKWKYEEGCGVEVFEAATGNSLAFIPNKTIRNPFAYKENEIYFSAPKNQSVLENTMEVWSLNPCKYLCNLQDPTIHELANSFVPSRASDIHEIQIVDETLVTSSYDGTIKTWNRHTRALTYTIGREGEAGIVGMFIAAGKIYSHSRWSASKIWVHDLASGVLLKTLELDESFHSITGVEEGTLILEKRQNIPDQNTIIALFAVNIDS